MNTKQEIIYNNETKKIISQIKANKIYLYPSNDQRIEDFKKGIDQKLISTKEIKQKLADHINNGSYHFDVGCLFKTPVAEDKLRKEVKAFNEAVEATVYSYKTEAEALRVNHIIAQTKVTDLFKDLEKLNKQFKVRTTSLFKDRSSIVARAKKLSIINQ